MFREIFKKAEEPDELNIPAAESDLLFKDATKDQLFDSIIQTNGYVILRDAISSEKIDYFSKCLQPHASKYWQDIDKAVLDDEKFRSKLSHTHEIPDKAFIENWGNTRPGLLNELGNGNNIFIHCKGGIGRSGTVAAMFLIESGTENSHSILAVRSKRQGAIENEKQEDFVRSFEPRRIS